MTKIIKEAMKDTAKVIFKIFLIICGIYLTVLTCDLTANYIHYVGNGVNHEMALEWAREDTERRIIKPVDEWIDKLNKMDPSKSEVLEFPMVIQSIQGNTLINEYKSGR